MNILVTGAAGFIGFHTANTLLQRGDNVIGVDNLNDYYEVSLKQARLQELQDTPAPGNFTFIQTDINNTAVLSRAIEDHQITHIINLAAQAGVRYSIENPSAYVESNIQGFLTILELAQTHNIQHLVYASSSSVYGNNQKVPYSEDDQVDNPISMYAATKKSNELMAHVYSHLYQLPTTGLRFFTVYGPWGRPDMSPFIFAKAILDEQPIKLFNHGNHERDFTYIDDIVSTIIKVLDNPADGTEKAAGMSGHYRLYNIGNHNPANLRDYVALFEKVIGKQAIIELAPMQPGDVERTYADVSRLEADFSYQPSTSLEQGIERFVAWYRDYYHY